MIKRFSIKVFKFQHNVWLNLQMNLIGWEKIIIICSNEVKNTLQNNHLPVQEVFFPQNLSQPLAKCILGRSFLLLSSHLSMFKVSFCCCCFPNQTMHLKTIFLSYKPIFRSLVSLPYHAFINLCNLIRCVSNSAVACYRARKKRVSKIIGNLSDFTKLSGSQCFIESEILCIFFTSNSYN